MIDTHGLDMIGLQEASDATADWPDGYVSIIRYDRETGRVWTTEAADSQLAGPHDVFRTARRVDAQRIADEIAEHIRLSGLTPQARYDAKNTVSVTLKINRRTDADILARLAQESNRQGYIKRLIRDDIARLK